MGNLDFEALDKRARAAGYGDGLLEIFAAIILLVLALGWAVSPGLIGVLAALIVLYGWKLVERIRARVTYPRIGYFRERSDDVGATARGMLLFIGGALAVMVLVVWLAGGLGDVREWRRAAPLLSGISLAGGFWYAGGRSGFAHYRFIAVVSVVVGVLLWMLGKGDSYAFVAWHLAAVGVPLAVIGVWSLVRFVRSHPDRGDIVGG